MPKCKVDKDACIGCGACVASYPDMFVFDDEGKAEATGAEGDAAEAAANCPVGAIVEE